MARAGRELGESVELGLAKPGLILRNAIAKNPDDGLETLFQTSSLRHQAGPRLPGSLERVGVIEQPVGKLSGGNQQKVVVAREMSRPLRMLVISQPTRGVDVGAMEFIHQRIIRERDEGRPVLLVSTELDEVMALSDRIAVMYGGKITAVVPADTSAERIGLLMAGGGVHA